MARQSWNHAVRHPQAAPTLAFRVGVTGARGPDHVIQQFRPHVEAVLNQIRAELEHLTGRSDVRAAYDRNNGARVVGTLTVLSPLAMGADRLVAEAAVGLGYRLFVPMPFPQGEYEKDFRRTPGSIEAFRTLLRHAGANTLALDGADDDTVNRFHHRSRSYEAVGRFVVHNCDLVIALWDGKPPNGRGGTHDIIRHAMEVGVPVWWIDVTDPARLPIWLNDVSEPRPDSNPRDACAELTDYMKRLIVPPEPPDPHAHGMLERLISLLPSRQQEPYAAYLATPPLPPRWWSTAHDRFLRWTSRRDRPENKDKAPAPCVARYWHQFHTQSGELSSAIGGRYRSSYVWLFLMVSLSITFAAFTLAFRSYDPVGVLPNTMAFLEAASLVAIAVIVTANLRGDWHQRWIDTRLLSELCRKQQYLSVIGWTVPGRAISRLIEEQSDPRQRERAAWVPWLFAALQRAAPLPHGKVDADFLREPLRMAIEDLVAGQQRYHRGRREQFSRASRNLSWTGELLFVAVIGIIAWKLWIWSPDPVLDPGLAKRVCDFLLIALPTFGAASVGIRAYAELDMVAEQSRHMGLIMARADASLRRLDPKLGLPLASQELGLILHAVTTNMLQDIDGWARMFRVKVIEAG